MTPHHFFHLRKRRHFKKKKRWHYFKESSQCISSRSRSWSISTRQTQSRL